MLPARVEQERPVTGRGRFRDGSLTGQGRRIDIELTAHPREHDSRDKHKSRRGRHCQRRGQHSWSSSSRGTAPLPDVVEAEKGHLARGGAWSDFWIMLRILFHLFPMCSSKKVVRHDL
jgi:hypothetical protein